MEYNLLVNGLQILARGNLPTYFFPPDDLYDALATISKKLPPELQFLIPVDSHSVYSYYQFIKVTAATAGDSLRLFIDLPLKSRAREFSLYRYVPWPTPLPDNDTYSYLLDLPYEYMALSADEMTYIHLEPDEATECQSGIRICMPKAPLLSYPFKSCLYDLIKGKEENSCKHKIALIEQPLF